MHTTLLIMAAGLGSRFGGLKQMAPVDEQGHWIIDFSIYDALRAGFGEIILIVKEENEPLFRETLGKRIGNQADLIYEYYVDHEEMLRKNLKQCSSVAEFTKMAKAMVLTNRLNPTRSNILSTKLVRGKLMGWRQLRTIDNFEANTREIDKMLCAFTATDFCGIGGEGRMMSQGESKGRSK